MEWVSMAKYAGLIEKSLGGEIELENLMQDKNTFYLGIGFVPAFLIDSANLK